MSEVDSMRPCFIAYKTLITPKSIFRFDESAAFEPVSVPRMQEPLIPPRFLALHAPPTVRIPTPSAMFLASHVKTQQRRETSLRNIIGLQSPTRASSRSRSTPKTRPPVRTRGSTTRVDILDLDNTYNTTPDKRSHGVHNRKTRWERFSRGSRAVPPSPFDLGFAATAPATASASARRDAVSPISRSSSMSSLRSAGGNEDGGQRWFEKPAAELCTSFRDVKLVSRVLHDYCRFDSEIMYCVFFAGRHEIKYSCQRTQHCVCVIVPKPGWMVGHVLFIGRKFRRNTARD
jgi:hypothetical protein